MGNLFSPSPKKPKVTEADRALLGLRSQRRKLEVIRNKLMNSIQDQDTAARQLLAAGKRNDARFALKKKKLQEQQLGRMDNWLLNVEGMLSNIESTIQTGNIIKALQQGNAAMKQLQQEVRLEDVERLMEETSNAAEHNARIQQLLGESWTGEDEAEAEAELERLEEDVEAAELAKLPVAPAVPVQEHAQEREEQDKLPELPDVPTTAVRIPELAA